MKWEKMEEGIVKYGRMNSKTWKSERSFSPRTNRRWLRYKNLNLYKETIAKKRNRKQGIKSKQKRRKERPKERINNEVKEGKIKKKRGKKRNENRKLENDANKYRRKDLER